MGLAIYIWHQENWIFIIKGKTSQDKLLPLFAYFYIGFYGVTAKPCSFSYSLDFTRFITSQR